MNDKNPTLSDLDLKSILNNPKVAGNNGSHYTATCPYCGKAKHFYINRVKQQWDCKKCGVEGNIVKLLQYLNRLFMLGDFRSIERSKLTLLSEMQEDADDEIELIPETRKVPRRFKRVYSDEYLEGRKFKPYVFNKYKIGYSITKKNHVLILIEEGGECVGHLGRLTWSKEKIERAKKKGIKIPPRWDNDAGAQFSNLLFGFNEITENTKTVILLEGVPDKITLDDILELDSQELIKCCATFGKKISKTQIMKLLSKGIENVILIFDEDAIREMKRYGKILSRFFNVKITFTYDKDINDSETDDVLKIFDRLSDIHYFDRKFVKKLK